jgi:hypothetical protein
VGFFVALFRSCFIMTNQHSEECDHFVLAHAVEQIEAELQRRLGGLVSDLRVVMRGQGLALQGRCRTHHARQIVQHAAMELTHLPILANEIRV